MNLKPYSVTLEEEIVTHAKNLQKELSGGENLSSLVNKLLEDWVVHTSNFLKISPIPVLIHTFGKTIPGGALIISEQGGVESSKDLTEQKKTKVKNKTQEVPLAQS